MSLALRRILHLPSFLCNAYEAYFWEDRLSKLHLEQKDPLRLFYYRNINRIWSKLHPRRCLAYTACLGDITIELTEKQFNARWHFTELGCFVSLLVYTRVQMFIMATVIQHLGFLLVNLLRVTNRFRIEVPTLVDGASLDRLQRIAVKAWIRQCMDIMG